MPANEIKTLRKRGLFQEAYAMAKAELEAEPDNIWAKRNISWVYYDFAKKLADKSDLTGFIKCLENISALQLPSAEVMLFDQLAWQIGKIIYRSIDEQNSHIQELIRIFRITQAYSFTKPSKQYSFLFKAFHKAFKNHAFYLDLPEWWGLENFEPEDYEKEELPDGKKSIALAEQAYITYAKHLLPQGEQLAETDFDRERAEAFITRLTALIKNHPEYQYPPYFKTKLLLALGDKEHIMVELLPFARKKSSDFWVWELLSEAFPENKDAVFACYCRALLCKSPEEMLVKLRQNMAALLIQRKMFEEAKFEIDKLVEARNKKGWKVPKPVQDWMASEWYKFAQPLMSNVGLYKCHESQADALLYADIPEEAVIVEFVNTNKKMLSYLAAGDRLGFFKYERFLDKVNIGEILNVRFQDYGGEAPSRVYTVIKADDKEIRRQFIKPFDGVVKIQNGQPFGFVEDIFMPPSVVSDLKLVNGMHVKGNAVKTYDKKKERWGWKYMEG
jgi:hypothetical protein